MSRIPRPLRLPLLVLLPALVIVVLLVALLRGGDPDPREVARAAFGSDQPIRSGVADLRARIEVPGVQGLEGPVTARLRGPFTSRGESAAPAFDFAVDATLGAQPIQVGAVSTGDRGFVRFQGQPFELSRELFTRLRQDRARGRGQDGLPSLASLGVDPGRWLTDPRYVGTEEQGGVDTVHVRSPVAVDRVVADLDRLLRRTAALRRSQGGAGQQQGLTAVQRAGLQQAIRGARLDFWAGEDDDVLRRVLVRLDLDTALLGGRGPGSAVLDLRVGELGEEQTVRAPQNAVPLAQLQEQLRGAEGGEGGGAGGTPGAGGAGAATPGAGAGAGGEGGEGGAGGSSGASEQQRYQQCVQAAGSDVDALRACVR